MKQFDAHLGRVNCLRFTVDSRQFVSCGDDSMVLLWNMQQLILIILLYQTITLLLSSLLLFFFFFYQQSNRLLDLNLPTCTPQATLPSHRLSVTYIQTTISNQLFTCSLDRTVKIWDLTTQTLLCTLVFPGQITAMVVDQAEQVLICGLETGELYKCILNEFTSVSTSVYDRMDSQGNLKVVNI